MAGISTHILNAALGKPAVGGLWNYYRKRRKAFFL